MIRRLGTLVTAALVAGLLVAPAHEARAADPPAKVRKVGRGKASAPKPTPTPTATPTPTPTPTPTAAPTSTPVSVQVDGTERDVAVPLHPGSSGVRVAGDVLLVGGGALAVVGATFAIVGEVLRATTVNVSVNGQPAQSTTVTGNKWLVPVGIGVGGAGVAALVAGIIALTQGNASIEVRPLSTSAARTEPKARYWLGEF
jgi:hypothetical protein